VPALLLASSAAVSAQENEREMVECRGQRVSEIHVEPRPPFPPTRSTLFARAARAASKLHETTRPEVIRRYLALEVGRPCTELRRTESERILRAQPFISDATVVAYDDGPDAVAIEVTTVDEISLILDGSVTTRSPYVRAVRVGEANLFGAGLYTALSWRDGIAFRDSYGIRLAHYQLFGRPYQFEVNAVRRDVGHDWSVEASHPYLTELQRIAWRVSYGMVDGYSHFLRPSDTSAALGLSRAFADIGGVVRIGGPGLLALVGGSLSHEEADPDSLPVIVADGEIRPDTSTVLMNRYEPRRQTRVNALLGFRDLRFMQVVGFETLDGVQDVAKGVQFSALFGKGIKRLNARSDEGVFVSAGLYGALGSPSAFAAADAAIEGRRDPDTHKWTGVISTARFGAYVRPIVRHTFITSVEFSGGWNSQIPFQLTFADREGGLRGFVDSRRAGGHRLVARFEDRYLWGPFRQYATLGLAGFLDAGKLWAGDAPFGANSPVSYAIGVSLLATVPPRSQRLLRVDLAYPLNPDGRRSIELRFTSVSRARQFWREPRDIRRVRERSVPTNVFNWP
jgi:hypothetical protein